MIWTLSKSICWAKPLVASDAAVRPAANSHAGFIVVAPLVPDARGMLSGHSPDRRRSALGLTLRLQQLVRTGEGHCPPPVTWRPRPAVTASRRRADTRRARTC